MPKLDEIHQNTSQTALDEEAVATLRNHLHGRIVLPGDADYDSSRAVWNGLIDRRPACIVYCSGVADVVAAVRFAREQELAIAVRGGGHHSAGTGVCDDGVVIDLSNMKAVWVNSTDKTAKVQGGATLGDVDRETQVFGLAVPTGTVSKTGIAGLTLAGGFGYLRRKYGLTCDNLISADVVTADGEVVHASESEHPDLFWAIRGGGGNFGVVTTFEYRLFPIGPEVFGLDLLFDGKDLKTVIGGCHDFLNHVGNDVSVNIAVTTLPPAPFVPEPLRGKRVIIVDGMYAGPVAEGEVVFKPLRELAKPIMDGSRAMPYVALQSKLDAMVQDGVPSYGESQYLNSLSDEVIDTIETHLNDAPLPTTIVMIWLMGGAMSEIPVEATAFGDRGAVGLVMSDGHWEQDEDAESIMAWVHQFQAGLKPYAYNGGTYLNATSGYNMDELVRATYGTNYERLVQIKRQYDPENCFRFNMNIPPNA